MCQKQPSLVAERLTISRDDRIIVDAATLMLSPHDFVLLTGDSGSGKSTLMLALAGLYPQYGCRLSVPVMLGDQIVAELPASQRSRRVAMLFQHPDQQFTMATVHDELIFALENQQVAPAMMEKRIVAALERVGVADLRDRQLNQLSGGEKQKVALAEVLAMGAHILLLDEPFAAVDAASRRELQSLLRQLADEGYTICVSDHDLTDYQSCATGRYHLADKRLAKCPLPTQTGCDDHDFGMAAVVASAAIAAPLYTMTDVRLCQGTYQLLTIPAAVLPSESLIVITGANGSGKSTLLLALARLHAYTGQITLGDRLISEWRLKRYAQHVALVFQDATDQFLEITVAEEIAQAVRHTQQSTYWTAARIAAVMAQTGLENYRETSVYDLSGGQQKQLQLLVMLILANDVLLLDEPLAGLDARSRQLFLALFREMINCCGHTVIMVTHQLTDVVPYTDYHAVVADGTLTVFGRG